MWEMTFMVEPSALRDVEHGLRVDERVLRWLFLKKRPVPRLPTTASVSKHIDLGHAPLLHNPWKLMSEELPVVGASGRQRTF